MKAVILESPGKLKYSDIVLRELKDGEAKVAIKAVGVCSSDIGRIFKNEACFYPIILGHEIAGRIEQIKGNSKYLNIGDKCVIAPLIPCRKCENCFKGEYSLCDNYDYIGSRSQGGLADYLIAPLENVVKIPSEIEYIEACLIEPISVVLHGLLKIKIPGKRVLIIGAGSLGLIAVQIVKAFGCFEVIICDLFENHLKIAQNIGIKTLIADEKIADKAKDIDIAIETSGSINGFISGLEVIKKGGCLLNLGTQKSSIELKREVINRITKNELKIIGSWNSYSAPFPGIEWDLAIEFLKNGTINAKILFSHLFKFSEAETAFDVIYNFKKGELIKAAFINNL